MALHARRNSPIDHRSSFIKDSVPIGRPEPIRVDPPVDVSYDPPRRDRTGSSLRRVELSPTVAMDSTYPSNTSGTRTNADRDRPGRPRCDGGVGLPGLRNSEQ